jgi:poly-gamma-glutamate synthesis protein (capsule biosynthesis protein)
VSDQPVKTLTFLGDLACPYWAEPRVAGDGSLPFGPTVINLEGAICSSEQVITHRYPGRIMLYNRQEVGRLLEAWDVRLACLANNHLFDCPADLSQTTDQLAEWQIGWCGAGHDLAEAQRPARVELADGPVDVLNFGWHVIGCPPAGPNRAGVNPLDPAHVLDSVRRCRADDASKRIVLVMHWDYELEQYPQPRDRQLAFAAIDAGASAVVGHHPHLVQGIEVHRGAPIVYSVGNWFIPHGTWQNRPVRYPAHTRRQLAFEWDPAGASRCHWFEYDPAEHTITHQQSEAVEGSAAVAELTPFAGMGHGEYVRWFAGHRHKRRGLPIYRDMNARLGNAWRDRWVTARQSVVEWLAPLRRR